MSRPKHIVVVGNGIAGFELCRRLSEPSAPPEIHLTVFGEERTPAYDRVHLTNLLRGSTPEDISFGDRSWYESRNIKLRTGDAVTDINRDDRAVFTASGAMADYDYLVLATGSAARVPPIPGVDHPDVFVYRTIADVQALRIRSRSARRAIVLGGGLLGLEAAGALDTLGLEVTVVEAGPHLMNRQLVPEAAVLLRRRVEKVGVKVYSDTAVETIRPEARGLALTLSNGGVLATDLVVLAVGIVPRDELGRTAGLDIGARGGIAVDNRLVSSDRRIIAIGECASLSDRIYGLARPAHQMAAVAAARLVGGTKTFRSADTSCRLDLLGVDVSVLGDVDAGEELVYHHDQRFRALYLQDNRIVGARIVGPWDEIDRLESAIRECELLTDKQKTRFEQRGDPWRETVPVGTWPATSIVCHCERVSRGVLTAAMREGCTTPRDLTARTRAGSVCGSCTPLLSQMCGTAQHVPVVRGRMLLLVASALAAIGLVVAGTQPSQLIDVLHLSSPWVTGLAMIAPLGLALVLPLRKRWSRFRVGNFGWFRAAHAVLGVGAGIMAAVHTRLNIGSNLNRALAVTFIVVVATGALLGGIAAVESRGVGSLAALARRWRPRLSWGHWLALWLFPVLLAFHIAAALYF